MSVGLILGEQGGDGYSSRTEGQFDFVRDRTALVGASS